MRELFYPPYGVWLHGDLSQIEMRGAAFVTQDEVLIDEYLADIDRHEETRKLVDYLVGWETLGKGNVLLRDPVTQRVVAKVINFNILFTHDPMSIEYNLHKNGIFGIGKDVLEPIFEEIHQKYNRISISKFLSIPRDIIKYKYISNYVRRKRRFDGVAWLDSEDAAEALNMLEETLKIPSLEYGDGFSVADLKAYFPKEIMNLFMEGWNFMIQGPFSGDIPKLIVSCIARKWKKEGVRATPFLTLYDSVEVACHPDDVERAVATATPYFLAPPMHLLTDAMPIWKVVPLGVEWSCGPNWKVQWPIEEWEEQFHAWKKSVKRRQTQQEETLAHQDTSAGEEGQENAEDVSAWENEGGA